VQSVFLRQNTTNTVSQNHSECVDKDFIILITEKCKTSSLIWFTSFLLVNNRKTGQNHLNSCCVQCCVERVNQMRFLSVHQKPKLAGCQKGINYTLTDSQQTQWVQHKQTLVSIHSHRWIKQHQSLSAPLISSLSLLLHFAQNLLTAFIVRFNIRYENASDFRLSTTQLAEDTFI